MGSDILYNGSRSLSRSLSFSLALHALFFFACFLLIGQSQLSAPRTRSVIIELNDPLEDLRKARQKNEREDSKRRIVQTTRGQTVDQAVKDAYLGEKNQVVDRQTVNKDHATAMGSKATPQVAKPLTEATPGEKTKAQTKIQMIPFSGPLSGLAVPIIPKKDSKQAQIDDHNWADTGNLPQDYVKGLKESERTALNTKEYVFYGYFQRIRERLDRAWVPILREKLVKLWRTGRQLASDMDHITQVLVVLNKSGEIIRVQVKSESGTRDLDDAAVRAFNQAGPFPNPPKGIVDPNGEIQIPWQFVLKT